MGEALRIERDGYVLEWNPISMTAKLHTTTDMREIKRAGKARRALASALQTQREALVRQGNKHQEAKSDWIIHHFLCQRLGV
jgi:hypothetical protein